MKALRYLGPDRIEAVEADRPQLGAGEALLKVAGAGICGTDMAIVAGKHRRATPPLIPGQGSSGQLQGTYYY